MISRSLITAYARSAIESPAVGSSSDISAVTARSYDLMATKSCLERADVIPSVYN
jgi:hypothetical protein